MRIFGAAALGIALAVPLAIASRPAQAENNDLMGQVQKFFNNGQSNDQNAYQRGREDEWRRQQAERDRGREHHDRYGYTDRRYDNRYSENGPRYQNNGYGNGY